MRLLRLFALLLALTAVSAARADNRWQSLGPEGGNVHTLVAAPSDPRTLYASTAARLYRSTDAGNSWIPCPAPTPRTILALGVG